MVTVHLTIHMREPDGEWTSWRDAVVELHRHSPWAEENVRATFVSFLQEMAWRNSGTELGSVEPVDVCVVVDTAQLGSALGVKAVRGDGQWVDVNELQI